jgi:hypothetical protein
MKLEELTAALEKLLKTVSDYLATMQPEPAPKPAQKLLQTFCLAIKEHEGWYPGSRSYRNNNPGNAKFSTVGYLKIYQPVKEEKDGPFAVFKDYATGYLYLQNLVKHKVKKNPTWDFYDFFAVYAPDEDSNNSRQYAEVVAKRCNVSPTTKLSTIL